MVAIKQHLTRLPDGTVDIATWIAHLETQHQMKNIDLIKNAIHMVHDISKGLTTFYGQPCIEQGLMMAEILLELQLDEESIATAILISASEQTKLADETITKKLNANITKLMHSVNQMNVISNLQKNRSEIQMDRLRKTILAMVSDIRVVLIKLAEKTCVLRGIKHINEIERKRIAQEILDVYAPLANRLGVVHLKWELEDLSFHYTEPDKYKMIAHYLSEKRIDRQNRIYQVINQLNQTLTDEHIKTIITGRAKHIYSIYLKMQKKHLDFKNIYDASAIRILVDTVADCYQTLSIVHHLWEHIPDEFDDYIANPKPNGYQSIHTAVIGPDNKHIEIQIRTKKMNDDAEHGVAAHWLYKDSTVKQTDYQEKITFLRQLISWQKDIANHNTPHEKAIDQLFDDRIYVFTPAGDIIDLAKGATPLDFAYHVHSELGHRCRGAKINGHIVPLTHTLTTGDKVDIITVANGGPSRDWLNKDAGYTKTSRAKAKILQWFNQQDVVKYIESGKNLLDRELSRAGIRHIDIQKIAARFNFKNADALYSTLGHGSIRPAQILQAATQELSIEPISQPTITKQPTTIKEKTTEFAVSGINDLLTRIAKCCKPIPGDNIVGYITQGRGVSIHRDNCRTIVSVQTEQRNRLIPVSWDHKHLGTFYVDLQIYAEAKPTTLKEITTVLANAKIAIASMNSAIYKKNALLFINMTIEIHSQEELKKTISDISKLPHVTQVKRHHQR